MQLTKEEKDLFAYIDKLVPDDGQLVYDLTDKQQYRFAKMMASKFGDAENCPGALEAIDILQAQQQNGAEIADAVPNVAGGSGWENFFTIPGLGRSQTNNEVQSDGMATIVGGFGSMNLSLIVQNNQTKDIVASGFSSAFKGELLTVNTTDNPTGTSNLDVTSYLHYTYSLPAHADVDISLNGSSGVVKRNATSGVTGDPTLTAPVRRTTRPKNPHAINIGLGRPWTDQGGSTQFDYAWNEPTQNHPVGKIPFVGEVSFSVPIRAPLQPHSSIILNIYVADTSGGGVTKLPAQELAHVYSKFSISPTDSKKLVWNLPPGVNTSDPGDPLTFGNVPWSSDLDAFFYCSINVVLSDGNLGTAAVQSKMTQDADALDGTLEIMPIDFIWHCLGEDTAVTMSDGSTRPIAEILAGDSVQMDADGSPVAVVWTNKGAHKGDVVRIETAAGQTLTASGNHVVIGGSGAVPANELSVGDEIQTVDGPVAVTGVHREAQYDGMMYNLATRDHRDAADHDGDIATFVANGLIVGDINAQRALRHQRRHDVDWLKARVSPVFHTDIDNKFANTHYK